MILIVDGGRHCLTSIRTGFGQHGDYVFGWEGNSLQTAMDSACYLRNCSQLTEQAPEIKNQCNVPVTVVENGDLDECKFCLRQARLIETDYFDRARRASGRR